MSASESRSSAGPRAAAISAVGLVKAYGEQRVLDGVDLQIPQGSVFSLLGPNGA
ncbi:ABC transporter, partial [Streptomyces montanus]